MGKQQNLHPEQDKATEATSSTEAPNLSRRKFTRNMVAGSAVLATLANRSAWGQVDPTDNLNCISGAYWWSYVVTHENTMPSHFQRGGGQDDLIEAMEADIANGYEATMVGDGQVCTVPPQQVTFQLEGSSTEQVDGGLTTLSVDELSQGQ